MEIHHGEMHFLLLMGRLLKFLISLQAKNSVCSCVFLFCFFMYNREG